MESDTEFSAEEDENVLTGRYTKRVSVSCLFKGARIFLKKIHGSI